MESWHDAWFPAAVIPASVCGKRRDAPVGVAAQRVRHRSGEIFSGGDQPGPGQRHQEPENDEQNYCLEQGTHGQGTHGRPPQGCGEHAIEHESDQGARHGSTPLRRARRAVRNLTTLLQAITSSHTKINLARADTSRTRNRQAEHDAPEPEVVDLGQRMQPRIDLGKAQQPERARGDECGSRPEQNGGRPLNQHHRNSIFRVAMHAGRRRQSRPAARTPMPHRRAPLH